MATREPDPGCSRPSRMRAATVTSAAGLVVLALAAVPGCAAPPDRAAAVPPAGPSASGAPEAARDVTEYRFVGTVLESRAHGPQLCHVVETSYPPQCGGPEVLGWDWSEVVAESVGGTTWGGYEVVGTWDGSALALTRPPTPPPATVRDPDVAQRFAAPCSEPSGGWVVPDPALTSAAALDGLFAAAAGLDGAAGGWIDGRGGADPPVVVLRTTGDVEQTREWLRPLWGGALCVAAAERTDAELRSAQVELGAQAPDAGYLTLSADARTNRVEVLTWLATAGDQERLDRRFGAGTVRLESVLEPVG